MTAGKILGFAFAAALGVVIASACGSNKNSGFGDGTSDGGNANGEGGGGGLLGGEGGTSQPVVSLTIDPPSTSIDSTNGAPVSQQFKLTAHYGDGSTGDESGAATWSSTNPQVGAMAGALFNANGSVGGAVVVTASYKGQTATANLNVKLHLTENSANASPAVIAALQGATTKDPTIQWAYPYDGTVFPRGLNAPLLQWNNGAASDVYYIHAQSAGFELQAFSAAAPPSRYAFTASSWEKFVDSSSGAATLDVARYSGTTATLVTELHWTIAPASMRGTIYYWANAVGRVMRIQPGATTPDDFSAGTFGALPASGCTMTCHTVSADGSTMVSGGDTLGGSYDLLKNQPIFDTGGAPGSAQKRVWSNAALSPNGKYLVENGNTAVPGPPGAADGMWKTVDGTRVTASGLDGIVLGSPSFSADGTKLAYVALTGANAGSLNAYTFDLPNAKVGTSTMLVPVGTGAPIQWPSVSPDANWIVYHRGVLDTRTGAGDLYLANANTPNQEIRLAAIDGDGYPFAAGARDLSFNYEPTFAPVPSGGYFWVVFTSRRTYGNTEVGSAQVNGADPGTKQLWVAAIDLTPTPGKDPSHAAFLLPGQDTTAINMRGFWALDPCKGDGQGCTSGTECCGGFCDGTGGDGGLVCVSTSTCGQDGDKCTTAADCCNATSKCINNTCAAAGPN